MLTCAVTLPCTSHAVRSSIAAALQLSIASIAEFALLIADMEHSGSLTVWDEATPLPEVLLQSPGITSSSGRGCLGRSRRLPTLRLRRLRVPAHSAALVSASAEYAVVLLDSNQALDDVRAGNYPFGNFGAAAGAEAEVGARSLLLASGEPDAFLHCERTLVDLFLPSLLPSNTSTGGSGDASSKARHARWAPRANSVHREVAFRLLPRHQQVPAASKPVLRSAAAHADARVQMQVDIGRLRTAEHAPVGGVRGTERIRGGSHVDAINVHHARCELLRGVRQALPRVMLRDASSPHVAGGTTADDDAGSCSRRAVDLSSCHIVDHVRVGRWLHAVLAIGPLGIAVLPRLSSSPHSAREARSLQNVSHGRPNGTADECRGLLLIWSTVGAWRRSAASRRQLELDIEPHAASEAVLLMGCGATLCSRVRHQGRGGAAATLVLRSGQATIANLYCMLSAMSSHNAHI